MTVLEIVAVAVALLAAPADVGTAEQPGGGGQERTASPAELVQRLGAGRYAEREAASEALEALGAEALPALRAARDDPDAEIRRRAGELSRRIEVTRMVDVRAVLAWLPVDIETLVVARGPFAAASERQAEESPATQFFQLQASGVALDQRLWARVEAVLPEMPLRLAVEGSRRFRGRLGPLGEQYEGVHLLVFNEEVGPSPGEADVRLAGAADRVELVGGNPVAVFEGTNLGRFRLPEPLQPEVSRTLFVAWVRPDVLAISGHRAMLATVLARAAAADPITDTGAIAGGSPGRALPDDLPEWAHVVPTAPAWALRHYAGDRDDPTSPRTWDINGRRYHRDPGAVGLVTWVDPSGTAIEARYLTDHVGAIAAIRPYWTSRLDQTKVTQQAPGVVAIRLPAGDTREAIFAWFTIATALGHPATEKW